MAMIHHQGQGYISSPNKTPLWDLALYNKGTIMVTGVSETSVGSCVRLCVQVCVCATASICVCVSVCVCVTGSVHVCVSVCMYVYTCVCVCVCVQCVCQCLWQSVCVWVPVSVCVHVSVHVHACRCVSLAIQCLCLCLQVRVHVSAHCHHVSQCIDFECCWRRQSCCYNVSQSTCLFGHQLY